MKNVNIHRGYEKMSKVTALLTSVQKHKWIIPLSCILIFFVGIFFVEQPATGGKAQKNTDTYHVAERDEDMYLKNRKGKRMSGWFMKLEDRYKKLGSVTDLGNYKKKKFPVIYADEDGKIAADTQIRDFIFNKKGQLAKLTGSYRIKGKYYFFRNGKLWTSDIKYKKAKYYINLDGTVHAYLKKGKFYSPSGKKLKKYQIRHLHTTLYAREIIKQITTPDMTKKEKLQKCFKWVVKNYSYVETVCDGKKGWTAKSGAYMLKRGIGDCRALAMGFVYLADGIGYKNSYLCQDCKNRFSGSHCWAMINGRYYDPLFYNTKKPQRYMAVFNGSTPEAYAKKTHCHVSQKFRPGQ